MEWQPIDTAPRNGSVLLLWGSKASGSEGMVVAKWHDPFWVTSFGGMVVDNFGYSALAWMPLPDPPESD